MLNREASLTTFRVVIRDGMTDEIVSDTAYTSDYDATVAVATARDAGMVPPGGSVDIEVWRTVFRLDDAGDWQKVRTELVSR